MNEQRTIEQHVHTDECWEPDSGCDMGRNERFAAVSPPDTPAKEAAEKISGSPGDSLTSNPGVAPTPETEFALKKQIARELDDVLKRAYPGERVGVMMAWWRQSGENVEQGQLDFTTNVQSHVVVSNVLRTLLARVLKGMPHKFHDVKVRD